MTRRPLAPVAFAAGVWALGTLAVVRHVLLEDDFVSSEIRRHGVVPQLLATLVAFSLPYLALGFAAAWVARGLGKLGVVRREGWAGSAIVACGLGTATLFAAVERPALFAGLLWRRGGAARALQTTIERVLTPDAVAWIAGVAGVALVAAASLGWWRTAPRGGRRAAWITAGTLGAALAVVAVGPLIFRRARIASPDARPNVLLVIVDSMRPDRALDPAVAPNIAALAARSVRFTDTRTPCALTYPAIASLLTSRHPAQHGVRHLYPEAEVRKLGPHTLPRALDRAGYETIAVGGYCASPLRELDSGFEVQRTQRSEVELIVSAVALRGHPWLPATLRFPWMRALLPQLRTAVEGSHPLDLTREAVAAWRRTRSPFFLTVFYDNAHLPYVPVWPDSRRAAGYDGPNRYTMLAGDLVEQIHEGESGARARSSEAERDNARALYDDALRSVDRAVGRLLRRLASDRLEANTVVMIVADHGENLLDFGGSLAHGDAVEHDRSNAVPWIVHWPGRLEPRVIDSPALLQDVAPTVLSLLGLTSLPGADGTDRAGEARGETAPPERAALLETGMWFGARAAVERLDPSGRGLSYPDFYAGLLTIEPGDPPHVVIASKERVPVLKAKHRRLELGPWALTYKPRSTGAAFALYRRDEDPGMTHDLAATQPEQLRSMIGLFYSEAARVGDGEVIPPESP